MSLRYYMDHHVPAAITRGLRRRGIDCVTAAEDGLADSGDEQILLRATGQQRPVVTQDADFLAIAAEWRRTAREFAGVVFIRPWHTTIGQAVNDLELIARAATVEETRSRVLFLPL